MADEKWSEDDLRRAFVEGAKWWEYYEVGATMWPSDVDLAEAEAEKRYPMGQPAGLCNLCGRPATIFKPDPQVLKKPWTDPGPFLWWCEDCYEGEK